MKNIIDIMKEELEDDSDDSAYYTFKYLYNCLQSVESSKEVKYILAYIWSILCVGKLYSLKPMWLQYM